jgi:hypothetical protein
MSVYWETMYTAEVKARKGVHKGQLRKQRCTYKTKSLTSMHEHIRQTYNGSMTFKCESGTDWPFGDFSELKIRSPRRHDGSHQCTRSACPYSGGKNTFQAEYRLEYLLKYDPSYQCEENDCPSNISKGGE